MSSISTKKDEILKVEKMKSFIDLEKFVDVNLKLTDKNEKKYLIFNVILSNSKALTDISLKPLQELLTNESSPKADDA